MPGSLHTFDCPLSATEVLTVKAGSIHSYQSPTSDGQCTTGWLWTDMPVNVDDVPTPVIALLDYLVSDASGIALIAHAFDDAADDDFEDDRRSLGHEIGPLP